MPGKHDQEKFKFIGLWVHNALLKKIDEVRGEVVRSQFLRDAVAEKLKKITHEEVPREIVAAPDRAGKGGPRVKTTPQAVEGKTIAVCVENQVPPGGERTHTYIPLEEPGASSTKTQEKVVAAGKTIGSRIRANRKPSI